MRFHEFTIARAFLRGGHFCSAARRNRPIYRSRKMPNARRTRIILLQYTLIRARGFIMLHARFNYKATQGCMKYVVRRPVSPIAEINRVGGRSRQRVYC